jgi:hypothetical protein
MQVKIAQIIVDTFRARWASSVIPAISDAEITNKILPALTP